MLSNYEGHHNDIQEWKGKKPYEEQQIYIYPVYMYYIFTITIIYLKRILQSCPENNISIWISKLKKTIYSRPREGSSCHILFIIGLANSH